MAPAPQIPPVIHSAATSVTAFIGSAPAGARNAPTAIGSFEDYANRFGGLDRASELSYAVWQFFANGGENAVIVAVDPAGGPAALRAGIAALDSGPAFNLLCVPGAGDLATIAAAAECCEARRAFFIADPPSTAATVSGVLDFVAQPALPKSPNAALYFPWLEVADPAADGAPRLSAPSGTLAGVYACTDAARGVWSAPAGPAPPLSGILGPASVLDDEDNGLLTLHGINAIRTFPSFGTLIWGSRTLAGDERLSSDWKYVPVRRLALHIENSIHQSLGWTAFEPNAEALWAAVTSSVNGFMDDLWSQGALVGSRPGEAYAVTCGTASMTPEDVSSGLLKIIITFAPSRPAEFLLLQIQLATAVPV